MVSAAQLIAFQAVSIAVLTLVVPLRLYISFTYSRRSFYRYLGDSLVVVGWLMTWVCCACSWWRGVRTMGDVLPAGFDKETHAKLAVVEVMLYAAIVWCVKGAFLCMYLGMTEGLRLSGRWALWAGVGAVVASFVVVVGVHVGHCWPFERNWIYGHDACRLTEVMPVVVTSVLNVLTDLLIMVLPLLLFWTVIWRNKWSVAFLLGLGLLTIAATLTRMNMAYSEKLGNSGSRRKPVLDFVRTAEMWVTAELFITMLAVCLPAIRSAVVLWNQKRKDKTFMTSEMYGMQSKGATGNRDMYGGSRVANHRRVTSDSGCEPTPLDDEFR